MLGIRVNAVAPGPVDTAMAKAVHSPAIRADYHDAIPLGRYGLEEELAEAVFFLCSERASYITGQTLAVDGGFDAIGIGLPTFRKEMASRIERGEIRWRCGWPPGRVYSPAMPTDAPALLVRPRRVQRQWTPVPHRGPRAGRARAAG